MSYTNIQYFSRPNVYGKPQLRGINCCYNTQNILQLLPIPAVLHAIDKRAFMSLPMSEPSGSPLVDETLPTDGDSVLGLGGGGGGGGGMAAASGVKADVVDTGGFGGGGGGGGGGVMDGSDVRLMVATDMDVGMGRLSAAGAAPSNFMVDVGMMEREDGSSDVILAAGG